MVVRHFKTEMKPERRFLFWLAAREALAAATEDLFVIDYESNLRVNA